MESGHIQWDREYLPPYPNMYIWSLVDEMIRTDWNSAVLCQSLGSAASPGQENGSFAHANGEGGEAAIIGCQKGDRTGNDISCPAAIKT